jgi:glutaredoxin
MAIEMSNGTPTRASFVLFVQRGCISCELMRMFLDAHEIKFEERDIGVDDEARRTLMEQYESHTTPTLVMISGEAKEVVIGFNPSRLDQLLDPAPSSDAVTES